MPTDRSILVDSRLKPKEKLTALAICALSVGEFEGGVLIREITDPRRAAIDA
jgi:hypothetical protein